MLKFSSTICSGDYSTTIRTNKAFWCSYFKSSHHYYSTLYSNDSVWSQAKTHWGDWSHSVQIGPINRRGFRSKTRDKRTVARYTWRITALERWEETYVFIWPSVTRELSDLPKLWYVILSRQKLTHSYKHINIESYWNKSLEYLRKRLQIRLSEHFENPLA